jgi:hypothetical protein
MTTTDAIETYELRRIVSAGKPAWKWRVKGSLGFWTYAYTRKGAEQQIKSDANKKGTAFAIEEKGL